jgi:hypothetical protein
LVMGCLTSSWTEGTVREVPSLILNNFWIHFCNKSS